MDPAEKAALAAAASDAHARLCAVLAEFDAWPQCRVTLYVRTPVPADDILICSDDPGRLQRALAQRLADTAPTAPKTPRRTA